MNNYNNPNHQNTQYNYPYGSPEQMSYPQPLYSSLQGNVNPVGQFSVAPPDIQHFQQPDYTSDEFIKFIAACNNENAQFKKMLLTSNDKLKNLKSRSYVSKTKELVQVAPNQWILKSESGQQIPFATVNVCEKVLINVHTDSSFEAILFVFNVNGTHITRAIPYKDLAAGNVASYTYGIIGDPSNAYYKKLYVTRILFTLINQTPISHYINLPSKQGWNLINGCYLDFTTSLSYTYCLRDFLSDSIKNRIPINNPGAYTLHSAMPYFHELVPQNWKYRFLVIMRTASILLYFFRKRDLRPDQFFIIEPSDNNNAALIKSLLLTSYNNDIYVPALSDRSQIINNELRNINDGMVVFQDNANIEERKGTFTANIESIKNDINGNTLDASRHLISIISSNPTSLPYDLPARFLTFNDADHTVNETFIKNMHLYSLAFDAALINYVIYNPQYFEAELNSIIDSVNMDAFSQYDSTVRIIKSSAQFLFNHGFLNSRDIENMDSWIKDEEDWTLEPADAIVNDFEKAINGLIHSKKLSIVKQDDYTIGTISAFESDDHINFEKKVLKELIIPQMTTTRQITKIFAAFDTISKYSDKKGMYGTNGHRRNLRIRSSATNVSVYSFSKEILDTESLSILFAANHSDILHPVHLAVQKNFVPILFTEDSKYVARVNVSEDSDENFHMYVSGKSRYGKTYFLAQQAVFRAFNGDKVVVFDHDNSFSEQIFRKNFFKESAQDIEKLIHRCNIKESGIPVNLLNVDNCSNNIAKRDRIRSVLSAGIKTFGENQKILLGNVLLKILNARESMTFSTIADKINDPTFEEKKSLTKIIALLDDLKTNKMHETNWDDLFAMKKPIIIISTNEDSIEKSTILIDMMLSSLYNYKVHNIEKRTTVIVDELIDHNLTKESPIHAILRKGNKNKLHMLISAQPFPDDKSALGKIVGYTDMKVYFRQEDDSLPIAEKKISKSAKTALRSLERHHLIAEGEFYNKRKKINSHAVFYGKSADYNLITCSSNDNKGDFVEKFNSLDSEEQKKLMDEIFGI